MFIFYQVKQKFQIELSIIYLPCINFLFYHKLFIHHVSYLENFVASNNNIIYKIYFKLLAFNTVLMHFTLRVLIEGKIRVVGQLI